MPRSAPMSMIGNLRRRDARQMLALPALEGIGPEAMHAVWMLVTPN